jgi:hypothetical protein
MNEDQWLSCTDPTPMLDFLRGSGRASEGRFRLAACACVRQGAWDLLRDERCRAALDAREGYEDGLVAETDLKKAQLEAWRALVDALDAGRSTVAAVRSAAEAVGEPNPTPARRMRVAEDIGQWLANSEGMWAHETENWAVRVFDLAACSVPAVWEHERARQCNVLRCIFGNPYRPLPPLPAPLLAWRDGLIVRLAEGVYENRLLPGGRVAVLADALEDAGCQDAQILGHLRGPGPHVRGCHIVDLLLGKE